jgi:LacI family gluconate utilization system Gnt-I transcriptional repressor
MAESKSYAPSVPDQRVTLKQVAERAGVGMMTASRALRDPSKVSAALREKVFTAVTELGYIANRVASGLASGTSKVIPVLIPTLAHNVYVPFLDGAKAELDLHGYQTLLATTDYLPETEAHLVQMLAGWFPAGWLVAGVDHLPQTRRQLELAVAAGSPVVEFMDLTSSPIDQNIGFSHRTVGESVANYFADHGYRHIAYAGTLAEHDIRSSRRAEGFVAALEQRGLPSHYMLRSAQPFSLVHGGRLFNEVLERHPQVEAIFFANDDLAAGAILESRRRGIAVPGRVAVMGFNDTEIAAAMSPSISSVAVNRYEMGRIAARALMERIQGNTVATPQIDVGFQIIERESTARIAP